MNRLCADCANPLVYMRVISDFGKLAGYVCHHCNTVTERFGTLDVVRTVPVAA